MSDQERLNQVWAALGCASNPDDFKQSVRDQMWGQAVESIGRMAARDSRVYRENLSLESEIRRLRSFVPDVVAERERQDLKWGEQNHPDGTGADVLPVDLLGRMTPAYGELANLAKRTTDDHAHGRSYNEVVGVLTFADILLEEVFEAMAESDAAKLRTELIQVAAVAVQWAEAIDRRSAS